MSRKLGLWCMMGLLVGGATLRAQEVLRIVPLVQGDEVLVSFELADAYTRDVREAISSGLRTTFTYDVELRRVGTLWVDRTIASVSVGASDQYDNLTRRHILSRTVNGRIVESSVTEDPSVVGKWLTTFTRVPLTRTTRLDATRDYYVRISAHSRPQGASLLGWTNAVTGRAKFTFIP